jgi:hypothetical protein
MAINQTGNSATTQYDTWVPQMPGYSDFKSKQFECMRTPQQQIWWLYARICELPGMEDYNDIINRLDKLVCEVSKLWAALEGLLRRMGELEQKFDALAQNGMDYDVTKGCYAPTMPAQRRMWQAQMFEGMSVEDFSQFTVTQSSNMNVRHIAVNGRTKYMGVGDAKPGIPWQEGWTEPNFTPDAYVRKDELTLIDTDNLADHTIMGVLKEVADTRCPKPAPYLRPATPTDLRYLMVRCDDVICTTDNDVQRRI